MGSGRGSGRGAGLVLGGKLGRVPGGGFEAAVWPLRISGRQLWGLGAPVSIG